MQLRALFRRLLSKFCAENNMNNSAVVQNNNSSKDVGVDQYILTVQSAGGSQENNGDQMTNLVLFPDENKS